MAGRIRIRRRLTSGDIKDPELHRERITDTPALPGFHRGGGSTTMIHP